ncbi:AMIN domain-containing protein [Anabaena sp. FACHB-1237]|uniref:type IV pilus secretin family protein n=1 Tax=Anabaena sp. FACHB-1237 TaxID=2692769 RepID=UPI001680ABAC|nr:type IV pilus secretin family protein [Anabaena sp. FACHB-1237]MBD2138396.1 AMIN domain-containing protein [Anabaena sp. FACHB-1237]
MKHIHSSIFISSAVSIVLAVQPVLAQVAEVTDVMLTPVEGGITVILKTSDQKRPQVLTTKKDKSLVVKIINAKLRLQQNKTQNNNFRQENPAPGIASIEVNQLAGDSISVIVTGINNAPNNRSVVRKDDNLSLKFSISTESVATNAANNPPEDKTGTENNTSNSTKNVTQVPLTAPVYNPNEPGKRPDVLVPNPQVLIDGKPVQTAGSGQPYNQAPLFLPKAVAPPVGDITQSNIDTSPAVIDLGTKERVRRLVLRDAPVRDVLSLLARAAGMNLAYIGGEAEKAQDNGNDATKTSQKISLDIENESVQDVFNYVLRLSGLEANRSGRTIFVGVKLPNSSRDLVMRNLRLNQVTVDVALNFLVALGAESAVSRERLVTSVNAVPVGGAANTAVTQTQTTTETKIETQRITYTDSTPILRGLQASGDERTNSVTLIGSPKMVEMAVSQLMQLDIRRRQVVVNVKIIDVNLTGTQDYNTSFSFGVGNNFFVNDGGAASLNFGGSRPANSDELENSVTATPVTNNPLQTGDVEGSTAGISRDPTSSGSTTGSIPTLYQFPKRLLISLQAQVTSGNAKILTDPTLIVQEGQSAVVKLTTEVYAGLKTSSQSTGTTSSTTSSSASEPIIKEAGLSLNVKVERIDDNGFVSLSVAPTVSAPGGTAQAGGSNGTITLLSARSLASGVLRLRDGQTLILSGIIQDTDRTSVSKLPILGDIPLLGALFRKTNKQNERREVIILLTPQIMDDSQGSGYGYNYSPSPPVRDILERRGLKVQPK